MNKSKCCKCLFHFVELANKSKREQRAAARSHLTDELVLPPPGENITDVLDYDKDPEVDAAIANIPPQSDDVEMQDVNCPPGFETEVSRTRYDHNLVRASENT